jgi:glycosyltransferase involved in cell wall biosynthesis
MVRPFYKSFFEQAYGACEKLVPVSESLMTGLREIVPWVEQKTEIIPNMIREDMFLPPKVPREVVPFVFFWAGRLEHVKGIDLLLEAVRLLQDGNVPDFMVRLAGKGSLRKELEEKALALGLGETVRFLGRISREEMQKEMQQANCFVLPTRYEAFGAVLIEAMASGLPVIATRSGGPDSIVTGDNGLLIDVENVDQLAGAMRTMMQQIHHYSSETIRRQALDRFGQTSVMAQYHRLFLRIKGK